MTETRRVAIVMSRMPRLIHPGATWLSGLRACLRRIQERGDLLLTVPETAGYDFVLRGAHRLDIPVQQLSPDASVEGSVRDESLIDQADEVFVLGVRTDGNIHCLLIARLHDGRRGVYLVDLADLQPETVRQELLEAGAATWTPSPSLMRSLDNNSTQTDPIRDDAVNDVVTLSQPPGAYEQFLTHTTRACPGPWPRQSTEEYLDYLLDSHREGDHSARMTLSRIFRQQQLIASSRTIRGGFSVVSFTEVPLPELPKLRCFRTHRSRWDFEPYGISIRRSALERHDVRPVVYGSDEIWTTLSETERPYFQLNGDRSEAAADNGIDWSVEREWRHLGDLDLSLFTGDDLFVFVPSYVEARALQPYCPWPVTLWPGELE